MRTEGKIIAVLLVGLGAMHFAGLAYRHLASLVGAASHGHSRQHRPVVTGFVAAILLYEATVPAPRNDKRDDTKRREQLRTLGLLAAIVAVAAAYVAAIW